jgi:membrane AbrB-like protein
VLAALNRSRAARIAATIALSASGGFLAESLGIPAGWIAGGLLIVAAASLAGLQTEVPHRLRPPIYLVLGIFSGSGVSPETFRQMQTWPASFAVLGLSLVALIAGSYWWLHGKCGWDRNSALLASMPGALSFVLAAAEDLQADMKKVAIAQCLRLLVLVELIPLLALLMDHPASGSDGARLPNAGPAEIAALLLAGSAAALVCSWLKLPAAWLIGGLFASAALLLSGYVQTTLPGLLVIPCMVGLAAVTGSRFRPGDLALLPAIAKPSLAALAIAAPFPRSARQQCRCCLASASSRPCSRLRRAPWSR